ncbi:hypothetical protein EXIGLDRAFT_747644 [Exidia glandulosa HHB12029]|uniref:Uncharacterized protein n=1 Tax=Exidia glandulosa HHB12029 TaxID=1314781 RepID=A0A165KIJ1_EXIGL|nr:hypothetical protein EXIGLDRAFT_747644 [Exidia glandulosa HHB12029]
MSTPLNPFLPSTTFSSGSSPSASKRPVSLPALPELHDAAFLDKLLPAESAAPKLSTSAESSDVPSNPFMDALKDAANIVTTANGAVAFGSSGSACLDVFSGLNAQTEHSQYEALLGKSWAEDPLATLRLIWHLRSIHDGHGEREPFYRAFAWLYQNHPRTAIGNLEALVAPLIQRELKKKKKAKEQAVDDEWTLMDEDDEVDKRPDVQSLTHGYFKDLLNILVLATQGELKTTSEFHALHTPREKGQQRKPRNSRRTARGDRDKGDAGAHVSSEARIQVGKDHNDAASKSARDARDLLHRERSKYLDGILETDLTYRALYIAVARIFAQYLAADIATLRRIADDKTGVEERVHLSFTLSLAGKWAPSINNSHDRICNISTAVAELLYVGGHFPTSEPPLSQPVTQDEAHRIRGMYTRWVLSPLRRFLQIPEVLMSAKRWTTIRYQRVPSTCMSNNADLFNKHDAQRFSQYLLEVAQGTKKISGATLLPHELLLEAAGPLVEHQRKVVEAQWNTMVESVRDAGVLENCLAVCDVSGSMGNFVTYRSAPPKSIKEAKRMRKHVGTTSYIPPIAPALALSLVLAQTAREPWRNSFITFSSTPEIIQLDPTAGLVEQAYKMNQSSWGMTTSYSSVFLKLLLPMAVRHQLKREDMIKRLFVFSDMEFDDSRSRSDSSWATEHELIKAKFDEAGYDMPEIVYWNLQGSNVPRPVRKDEPGTALVTGFSPNMLKLFMAGQDIVPVDEEEAVTVEPEEDDGDAGDAMVVDRKVAAQKPMDPMSVMKRALDKASFATLKIED